ncbi:hypothetical protein [Shewanella glacialimarina]|uniref:hypothetical protein n=1 Tax=Shewanella glacialimarina TaxID=2590884 RepID=UPI001CF8564A|nr:hypothetical protein [Shewanella glacialimarina]UCX03582.1 hypothetical protein FJ709_03005 [Shewanella glacialimarina]
MTQQIYKGFHTCKNKGGYEHVVSNIPFRSGHGENQWLTEGFYFWTDSPYWAKEWLSKQPRVIGEFKIELCRSTELLDLVGNVEHQLEFVKLKNTLLESIELAERKKITVHQVISYFRRRENMFPYSAIKAEDGKKLETMRFIDSKFQRSEKIDLVTRQQMCVFEKARDRIQLVGFEEPTEFQVRFTS